MAMMLNRWLLLLRRYCIGLATLRGIVRWRGRCTTAGEYGEVTMLSEKYRPATFDDIIGQHKTIDLLRWHLSQQSDSGRALLLTGPSGCGKTSLALCAARFWGVADFDIHRVESATLDVAAVRRLAEDVAYFGCGTSGRKVYVIDEVHTVGARACDRLLSLLENLPQHVTIVATSTETNWSGETLLSRWLRFDITKPRCSDVAKHLEWIAAAENLPTNGDTAWATKYCKATGLNLRTLINQLPAHLLGAERS